MGELMEKRMCEIAKYETKIFQNIIAIKFFFYCTAIN